MIYITEDIRSTSGSNQKDDSLVKRITDDIIYLNLISKDPIHILLDTDGGNLKTALTIYDILLSSRAPVYTYGLSEVSSAGVLIYIAGKKRFAFKHTQFMTHESSLSVTGSKKDFEATSHQCLEQNAQVEPIFKKRLGMGIRKFKKLHEVSSYMWAEEAKEYNRIDKIFMLAQSKLGGPWEAFKNATLWRNSKDKDESKWANIFYIMMQKRKKLCYNASSKISTIINIVNQYNNRKALVFSESIDFASELQDQLGDECVTFHSKMKKKEREIALKSFGDGRTKKRVISSVKALNQGLNVPDCSLGICAAGSSKALDNIQRTGRTLRLLEGKVAIYINLYVRGTQEVKWVRKRTKDEYNAKWIEDIKEIKV